MQQALVWGVSLAAGALLLLALRPEDIHRLLAARPAPESVALFVATAACIAVLHAWRWRLLLDRHIALPSALVASMLGLGGNMFLPVRGGDLLRVHYSHLRSGKRHGDVLGSVVIEKLVELAAVACIGLLAAMAGFGSDERMGALGASAAAVFVLTLAGILLFRRAGSPLVRALAGLARKTGRTRFIAPHLVRTVRAALQGLGWKRLAGPSAITLVMWMGGYAGSYLLAARMFGVPLSYSESLVVLAAGTLGLMLPAAPSGLGTFHAAVVSAFLLMHRPAADGLLVATAVHLLFFVTYVVPAALLYARWRLAPAVAGTP